MAEADCAKYKVEVKGIDIKGVGLTHIDSHIKTQLALLLCDCVDSGASVGYIRPLTSQQAGQYWNDVEIELNQGLRYLLIAQSADKLLGAVQLSLCNKANGLHRAEIEKLMVHTQSRGQGVAKRLMQEVEVLAHSLLRNLLVLDTKKGDLAEGLYIKMGYRKAGEIPRFALSSSGELDTTVLFYKEMA